MPVTGVVLAGGRSSRFGHDKAMLEFDGRTLLQRTVATMHTVTSDVIVLGPRERAKQVQDVQVVQDDVSGIGPLGGIYTALRARPGNHLLVVAVDMPFLNADVLRYLVDRSAEADVIVPLISGWTQQTHTVYGPACLTAIEAQIAAGDYKIDRFFDRVTVRRIEESELRHLDPRLQSFRNVNTPDLWEAALAQLREQQRP